MNRLNAFASGLESDFQDIENYMKSNLTSDTDFKVLGYPVGRLNVYLSTYNILQKYKSILAMKKVATCFFLYSEQNDYWQAAFQNSVPSKDRQAIKNALAELVQEGDIERLGWFVRPVNGKNYCLRALGYNGAYQICAVDLEHAAAAVAIDRPKGEEILFVDSTLLPLTSSESLNTQELPLHREETGYYYQKGANPGFVLRRGLNFAQSSLVLLLPYEGLLSNLDGIQIFLLCLSAILFVALIPLCILLFKKSFFYPLRRLTQTMQRIKSGDWEAKMDYDSPIEEFAQMSGTFNDMVEEITHLKIVAYEQTLQAQSSQLRYIHMQIRPHFYLNCLKKLYGMAQCRDYAAIQDMLLALSDYLRNMFGKNEVFTTLETELHNAETFISLQNMGPSRSMELTVELAPELAGFQIPPFSVLTFVENAVKHGQRVDFPLVIHIRAALLEAPDGNYVNISIMDNGPGFSQAQLRQLNTGVTGEETMEREHIGILNIKQRFALLYQDRASITFTQRNGADVEIFLPFEPEPPRQPKPEKRRGQP